MPDDAHVGQVLGRHARGKACTLRAVADQHEADARVVAQQFRCVEHGVEPVRHTVRADIGGDETLFEADAALKDIGIGTAPEQ